MRKSYVYKIMCKITGEFYFGSSFNAKSDYYWGGGTKIRERIAQYGKENFIKEILGEFDDRVEANKKENEYIEQFRHDDKCLNERIEYHFGLYGEESRAKIGAAKRVENLSDETRAKMSAAKLGKHLSEEHRAKISAANRGKHLSEETRAKIGAAQRGEKHHNFGKHLSEEHRAKIGAAKLGEKNPNFGKHFSDETRAKLSAVQRGKIFSGEHRAKISAALRGKHHTDVTREKMSAAHRGKLCGKHWRKNPITGKREWYE